MMLDEGATHVGVATDHVIESFRNDLWPTYKTGDGIDPLLQAQFPMLEDALGALGVAVWAMVDLEADDALASAAVVADADDRVEQVVICTPDKDLGQCVGGKVVQLDRRRDILLDADGVRDEVRRATRSRFRIGSRSSVTPPTGSPVFRASVPRPPRRCSTATATSRRSPTTSRRGTSPACAAPTGSRRRSPPAATVADQFKVLATLRTRRRRRDGRRLGVARADRRSRAMVRTLRMRRGCWHGRGSSRNGEEIDDIDAPR